MVVQGREIIDLKYPSPFCLDQSHHGHGNPFEVCHALLKNAILLSKNSKLLMFIFGWLCCHQTKEEDYSTFNLSDMFFTQQTKMHVVSCTLFTMYSSGPSKVGSRSLNFLYVSRPIIAYTYCMGNTVKWVFQFHIKLNKTEKNFSVQASGLQKRYF